MYKITVLILLALSVNASDLIFSKGELKAHTEIFGENNINPATKQIKSNLSMQNSVDSLKGIISIKSLSLKSDNSGRDEHMYEVLNAKVHPYIKFDLKSISQTEKSYKIKGLLTINGVTNTVESSADITNTKTFLNLSGSFSINLTDFNMEPPALLFLTVRDKIDITYDLSYDKKD